VKPVSTCGRKLLRRLWRLIGLMVSFIIFTASVRSILDTTTYIQRVLCSKYKPIRHKSLTWSLTNKKSCNPFTFQR
jgi:hypothetical protein